MSHDSYTGRQQQVFTNWINAKVKTRGLHVDDILEDLKSGVVLYNLLEELSHQVRRCSIAGLLLDESELYQSLAPLGKLSLGQTQIHRNVNMSVSSLLGTYTLVCPHVPQIVFRYLTQTIKMVGIGPADIVEGNPSLTLGLIWSIIGKTPVYKLVSCTHVCERSVLRCKGCWRGRGPQSIQS
jgi:spectrin beta